MLLALPRTGIAVWRPRDEALFDAVHQVMPRGSVSTTTLAGQRGFRSVAANPQGDIDALAGAVIRALDVVPIDARS